MSTSVIVNIVIMLIFVGFVYLRFRPIKGLRTLNSNEFSNELGQVNNSILIDVREPSEYRSGYIPGAKNIPLSQLPQRLGNIPKDKRIFLYCRSGMRSKNAAKLLQKNGYTTLAHLQGGLNNWHGKLSR